MVIMSLLSSCDMSVSLSVLLTASAVFSTVSSQTQYWFRPVNSTARFQDEPDNHEKAEGNLQWKETKDRLMQSLENSQSAQMRDFLGNISDFVRDLEQTYFKLGVSPRNTRRLHKALRKARNKEPVNVLIIGGSNSAGGGIDRREGNLESTYYGVFTRWWRETMTPITGSELIVYNIAIGGTGAALFAFCFDAFIPVNQSIDIVLVELAPNYELPGKAKPLEQLTRRLLTYYSIPEVLYVNAVGMDRKSNPRCENLEDFGQTELADYYQITSFSLKNIICPMVGGQRVENLDIASKMTSKDGNHISIKAHAYLGRLLINHIREVFLAQIGGNYVLSAGVGLPEPLFLLNPLEVITNPQCSTSVTPNYLQNFYHRTLNIQLLSFRDFTFYVKPYVNFWAKKGYRPIDRMDKQRGWLGRVPGAYLKYGVVVPPCRPKINQIQSRSIGVIVHNESERGGKGLVYLDQKRHQGIVVDAKTYRGTNDVYTIATRVPPGYHTITVEVLSEGMLLITGVVVGPPDFCCKFL
ncbi:uncharacterized protein LOC116614373 [Nematostella vectensis]|uniref:uncharacterized protein LOC116614373 n=1 Tax=Nematostella vectensis TaxID=45351 RepID=UPI002076EFAB|nr:uncharacterized protein LOC116614373 [Nematostella vectensis]